MPSRAPWPILVSAIALLVGCGGGGGAADITFELALPVDDPGCGSDLIEGVESLRSAPCATVRVFEQTPSGLLQEVRLFDPDGDHAGLGSLERRVLLDDARTIAFDLRVSDVEQPHTLVFRVYDGSLEPAYGATVENRRFGPGNERLRVRLYPFREWACAGRDLPERTGRALHSAIRMPTGDVLFIGGIRGAGIRPESFTNPMSLMGAPLEPSIIMYDADEHQFVALSGSFARVGFAARYDRVEEDGRHVIQVIGGYTMPAEAASSPAVLFNNTAGIFGAFGAPWYSSTRAERAESVELLVDLTNLQVEERPIVLTGAPRGAINAVSEMIEVDTPAGPEEAAAVLIGFTNPFRDILAELPVSETFFFLQPGTGNTPAANLATARLGATVTALPNRGAFLVWGGSVDSPSSLDIQGAAGELLFFDMPSERIATGPGIPAPAAFHTATRFPDDDTVLIVGGHDIRTSDGKIGAGAVDPRIFALRADALGVSSQAIVSCTDDVCPYVNTIMHTATLVPDLGVVVVGGSRAVVLGDGSLSRFDPVDQVGVVTPSLAWIPFGANLTIPRFGHTATLLDGNRLLVVGGLTLDTSTDQPTDLAAAGRAEVIYLDVAPPRLIDGTCEDTDVIPDAGPPPGFDAGPRDAGPPDAGLPPTDGMPPILDGGPDTGVVTPPPDAGV